MSTTFVKIPNSIIGNLKGHSCLIYLYLLYLCTVNQTSSVKVKQETIARKLGISFKESVNRTMQSLQRKGYISMKNNFNPKTNWQTCNTVTVCNFDPQSDYFLLPSEYIFIEMPSVATELLLTLYMYSFNDPLCFPSFKQISKTAKMGATSIVKAYTVLEEKGIIKKENYIKQDGSKGHNRYFLIKKIERIIGEEKTQKFMAWIGKQKTVCFLLWQLIKEVLTGNMNILEEICAQYEGVLGVCETENAAENKYFSDIVYNGKKDHLEKSFLLCALEQGACTNNKQNEKTGLLGFIKQKTGRICGGIRRFFSSVFQGVKNVLL